MERVPGTAPSAAKVIDPVCGMDVDPATAEAKAEHEGTTFHFCCDGRFLGRAASGAGTWGAAAAMESAGVAAAIDPVCGMKVDVAGAKAGCDYKDESYFFCSERCYRRFQEDPERCLAGAGERRARAVRAVQEGAPLLVEPPGLGAPPRDLDGRHGAGRALLVARERLPDVARSCGPVMDDFPPRIAPSAP